MSARTKVAEIEWPREWFGLSSWLFAEHVFTLEHKETGEKMYVAGGVLRNGTNLIGLAWRDGQNVARLASEHDWMFEERVDPNAPKYVRQTWRKVVAAMVQGLRDTRALMEDAL